jgi:hypothetical protein
VPITCPDCLNAFESELEWQRHNLRDHMRPALAQRADARIEDSGAQILDADLKGPGSVIDPADSSDAIS